MKIIFIILFFVQSMISQISDTSGFLFYKHFEAGFIYNQNLDLTFFNKITLPNKFTLQYDIYLLKYDDFGYLFNFKRVEGEEYLLTYFYNPSTKDCSIILGETVTNRQIAKINIKPEEILKSKWNKVLISFDFEKKEINLKFNDKTVIGSIFYVESKDKFNLSFGDYEDVSLAIREVIIKDEDGDNLYHWPLNEDDGEIVKEIVKNNYGRATGGKWLRSDHTKIKFVKNFKIYINFNKSNPEVSNIYYNVNEESINILENENEYSYNLITNEFSANSKKNDWQRYLIYNHLTKKLYRTQAGDNKLTEYNFKNKIWEKDIQQNSNNFRYHNPAYFINPLDSGIYFFGGYGWYKTYNDLFKFNFENNKWEIIKTTGERIEPRNTSIAIRDSVSFWIIGGSGNYTGEQIFKHHSFSDIWILDVRDFSFKKVWEEKTSNNDERKIQYSSAITTQKDKNLYVIKSIDSINYFVKIDTKDFSQTEICQVSENFSKIIYSKTLNKFYFIKRTSDELSLFSIDLEVLKNQKLIIPIDWFDENKNTIYIVLIVIILSITTSLIISSINKPKKQYELPENPTKKVKLLESAINHPIKLFGEFVIRNQDNVNISITMQKRIKEVVILSILLKNKNGGEVLIQELTEHMWPGKTVGETKSNRGIIVSRLRSFLNVNKLGKVVLVKKRFNLELNNNYKIDYDDYSFLLKLSNVNEDIFSEKYLNQFLNIVSSGPILKYENYEWLEAFQKELSFNVISILNKFLNLKMNEVLYCKLLDVYLVWDKTNENILVKKINLLKSKNEIKTARKIYEDFCFEFEKLNAIKYLKKFEDFS